MEYYIGLTLGSNSTTESGLCIIDSNNKLVQFNKLYTVQDIEQFFNNWEEIASSTIMVSLPWDNSMLEGKWRVIAKPYQMVATNKNIKNTNNWTQRYSPRGCELFKQMSEDGISVNRFDIYLARQSLKLHSCYKERTPVDCRFLQSALKLEYGFKEIPSNMMPMCHLEALVGAILAREFKQHPDHVKSISEFNGLPVFIA